MLEDGGCSDFHTLNDCVQTNQWQHVCDCKCKRENFINSCKKYSPPHPSLPLPSPRSLPPLPSLPPLLSLPSHSPSLRPHNSEAISDEVTVYKFNKEKAVLWLRAKVEAQASTLEKNKVYVGTGSQSSMLVRSNKRSDHTRG